MEQMWLIDRHGGRHGGVDAIKVASRRLWLLWPLAILLHIPFTSQLWRRAYMMVARRRYLISGKSECEGGACKVHLR
jgi:predicted DCC family thiol-disulfide oxidoreductase YuxK